jgi:prepilin peptidase CpaA
MDLARALVVGGALAILLLASAHDLSSRRIPNVLSLGGALLGLVVNLLRAGDPRGSLPSLEGWIVGVLLLAIPFAMGGIGAGDVKLLAAVGAWLGPSFALTTALFGALACGAGVLVLLVVRGQLIEVVRPIALAARNWLFLALALVWPRALALVPQMNELRSVSVQVSTAAPRAVPFAPALALGAVVALVLGAA